MPKYICENKECSLYNKEMLRDTVLSVSNGSLVDSGKICPECGKEGLAVAYEGNTTNMRGGLNICTK
jgi:hypothetical protein